MNHIPHLTEKQKKTLFTQIISEAWYLFLVMLYYYFVGIFYSLPVYNKGNKRKIVLITGFWGRNIYWKRICKKLIDLGYSVYPVNLGFQVGDIKKKSLLLEEYLIKHDINDCYMLAHSMGGWVALGLSSEAKERITKLFTLSTSFRGSYACYLVPMFTSSWQLFPGANFIDTQKENLKYLCKVKNIFVKEDEIAIPVETCITGIYDEVQFSEFGHLNLVMSKTGINFILEQIKIEEAKIKDETVTPDLSKEIGSNCSQNCEGENKKIIKCSDISENPCPYTITKRLPGKLIMGIVYFISGFLFSIPSFYMIITNSKNLYLFLLTGIFLTPLGTWGLIVSMAGIYIIYSSFYIRDAIVGKNNELIKVQNSF